MYLWIVNHNSQTWLKDSDSEVLKTWTRRKPHVAEKLEEVKETKNGQYKKTPR